MIDEKNWYENIINLKVHKNIHVSLILPNSLTDFLLWINENVSDFLMYHRGSVGAAT